MDHKALLQSLEDEEKHRLTARSDAAGLRHLVWHVGAIGACTAGIVWAVPGWPLLVFVQGILLCFLFTLAHECTHQTPFRTPRITEAAGVISSGLIGMSFTWFRYFHLAHHKHTNDPERDPELADGPRPDSWSQLIRYLSGWGYWSGNFRQLFVLTFGTADEVYLPRRQVPRMRQEARVLLGLYSLAILSLLFSPLMFWVWMLPLAVGQPVLRLYLLAEHGRCPPVANMLENSRTTFTSRLVRALAWNMPYHAEHHAYPNVPFHKLPTLHRHTRAHLKSTSNGYSEFAQDYVRDL